LGAAGLAPAESPVPQPSQTVPTKKGLLDAFVKTCQRWHLTQQQQIILLGYSGSEHFGRQLLFEGLLAPPQDARDRAGYILSISIGLDVLFDGSEQAELTWLNTPREVLNGKTALAFMLEGSMANVMIVAAMVNRERGM
jgi:hypothetical protein